jgi:signal transduction histidine kinase
MLIIKSHYAVVNKDVLSIVSLIKDEYPAVTDEKIMEVLNGKRVGTDVLKEYGVSINDTNMLENASYFKVAFIVTNISLLFLFGLILYLIFFKEKKKIKKQIKEITAYIKELNSKNYKLDIGTIDESDISKLKDEVYKTMLFLREQAENLNNDKKLLKDNLADISHQLKTPLTSIGLLIDNILDNQMDDKLRKEFLTDIKGEIQNINFLVLTLLKLSKFDTSLIVFKKEKISAKDIIEDTIKKVKTYGAKKKISFKIEGGEAYFYGDYKWELEALMNIVMNALEHSKEKSFIDISFQKSSLYTKISITNYGKGITKNEIKHIFDRFKSTSDREHNFGLGLALAKSIILKDNGLVKVTSKIGEYTKFEIRYFK